MPFQPGQSGNPSGGRLGSRHRQQLNGEFIAALLRDFRHGGPKAIERVRRTQPAAYLKILALLVPRAPRLKEWAYAGAVFTYTGAAASHLAVGDGAGALGPIGFAVIALAPWQTGSVR